MIIIFVVIFTATFLLRIILNDMNPSIGTHFKLLAAAFHTLKPIPISSDFYHPYTGAPLRLVEAVGVVVTRDTKERFVRFSLDDGTGCFPCILWLNHLQSSYAAARAHDPSDLHILAAAAAECARRVRLGAVVRVRGRAGVFRGELQVTVEDVVTEEDPNAEVLHWLLCIKLAGERKTALLS